MTLMDFSFMIVNSINITNNPVHIYQNIIKLQPVYQDRVHPPNHWVPSIFSRYPQDWSGDIFPFTIKNNGKSAIFLNNSQKTKVVDYGPCKNNKYKIIGRPWHMVGVNIDSKRHLIYKHLCEGALRIVVRIIIYIR